MDGSNDIALAIEPAHEARGEVNEGVKRRLVLVVVGAGQLVTLINGIARECPLIRLPPIVTRNELVNLCSSRVRRQGLASLISQPLGLFLAGQGGVDPSC